MIDEGDYVTINAETLTWKVLSIETRIDPLGVLLESGQTGRQRRETFSNLRLFKKGSEC